MRKPILHIGPSGDHNLVNIAIEGARDASETVRLNARDVENVIRRLAYQRQTMSHTPAADLDETEILLGAVDPIWRKRDAPDNESVVIDIRHSGLGWIRLAFHRPQADAFVAALSHPTQ